MSPLKQAALREHFILFLMQCFDTLHTGQAPLNRSGYLKAICHHLVEASEGRLTRLVITVPPRHLKSIAASVALCAWLLGRQPSLRIMVASYSQDLARQHAEQCRTIMESAWYQELFATRISDRGNRQLELITTAGGFRKAVSVGGSVTGFGADIVIVDDCMKAEDASSQAIREDLLRWYDGTLMIRLNNPATAVVISIQQRLHEDDLPAYLLEKGYYHLNLPAIAEKVEAIPTGLGTFFRREVGGLLDPARQSHDTLAQRRRDLGPAVFEAQYQQNPTVPEGNLIRPHWFGTYEGSNDRRFFHKVVQSWDTAATANPTSDWSVCTTWGFLDGAWYLLDVFRERVEYPDLKRAVVRLKRLWQPDKILVEHASAGIALVQELRLAGHYDVQAYNPRGDKETRLIAQTAELESGKFLLPVKALWLDKFLAEVRSFPNGRHDDQVDSLAQFVQFQKVRPAWVLEERTPGGRLVRIVRSPGRSKRR